MSTKLAGWDQNVKTGFSECLPTDNFMNILHQQASGGDNARIRKDKAIMRVIGSWIDKRTTEYLKATNNGESDGGYLGEKAKRSSSVLPEER